MKKNKYRIRELIGWLGILLPILLVGGNKLILVLNNEVGPIWLTSISHYHYTYSGVIFTGFLMAFGFLLISYKGYDDGEFFSDNKITNFAGMCAIIVVLIPTKYKAGLDCTPNYHTDDIFGAIHLITAGIFIVLLGVMSYFKFTLNNDKTNSSYVKCRNFFYKLCGSVIFIVMLLLVVGYAIEIYGGGSFKMNSKTFWLEVIALEFFGVSWLIKSKSKIMKRLSLVSEDEMEEKNGEIK